MRRPARHRYRDNFLKLFFKTASDKISKMERTFTKIFAVLLIVFCFKATSALECSERDRYNLTGLVNRDGVYTLNGLQFSNHYAFNKLIDGVNYTFGCECKSGPCFVKCCPLGYVKKFGVRKCILAEGTLKDRVQNSELSLNYVDTYKKPLNVKEAKMMYGIECDFYLEDLDWYLQEDGRLFIQVPGSVNPWLKREPDEYCIDSFIQEHEDGTRSTKLDALVCFPQDEEESSNYIVSSTCMLISSAFFIVTIAVYALLPELQNLHGRVLMVYLACMCVGFTFLAAMQIMITVNNTTITICIGLTFVIYFALLSAFFWLNVMCFDIWWTFSGKRGLSFEKLSIRARFCAYAAYAFGFPTGLTIIMAALEFSGLPAHPAMPMLRQQGCFLHGTSKLLYLYGPMMILCVANIVFFILTAWKITQIKQQTQKTLKSKDSATTDQHRNDRQRLLLYVKLFTIMGINWILEIISGQYPQTNIVFRIIDVYNVMIGVFIFIIFVCKRKIFRLMKKRFNETFRISHSDSEERPVGHRDVKNWKEYQQQRGSLDTVQPDARGTHVTHTDTNHIDADAVHPG
ncbi:G-protein coupled receptor Mth2-like isoform X1 [Leguminivora glycinivorella]|uniref:G-protein coupled receptor Mth2-like isoform X1 n=1 Tax=Leguminivora glycinivorella TaxID=1035111 RepID=UPI00200DCDC5|nr:G-protein coupled receptor Mth2-like isoform X1 [Leguminivora glycinivorella]